MGHQSNKLYERIGNIRCSIDQIILYYAGWLSRNNTKKYGQILFIMKKPKPEMNPMLITLTTCCTKIAIYIKYQSNGVNLIKKKKKRIESCDDDVCVKWFGCYRCRVYTIHALIVLSLSLCLPYLLCYSNVYTNSH